MNGKTTTAAGFTLAEVMGALGVVSVAISGLLALYSFAYKEGSQGREDTAGCLVAECVLNPLATALSSTNIPWSAWCRIGVVPTAQPDSKGGMTTPACRILPADGWLSYMQKDSRVGGGVYVTGNPIKKARGAYADLLDVVKPYLEPDVRNYVPQAPQEQGGMSYAVVISRDTELSPIVNIAVRPVRANRFVYLMGQTMYYTAVHFQGDPNR